MSPHTPNYYPKYSFLKDVSSKNVSFPRLKTHIFYKNSQMRRLDPRWGETAESLFQQSILIENKRLRERYLALALVASGRSLNQAAEEVGRQRQTVGNWVKQFNEKGLEGLEPRFKGIRQSRLTDHELDRLGEVLNNSPEDFGFTTSKWRSWQVAQFIEDSFGKKVHIETARRYLLRLFLSK